MTVRTGRFQFQPFADLCRIAKVQRAGRRRAGVGNRSFVGLCGYKVRGSGWIGVVMSAWNANGRCGLGETVGVGRIEMHRGKGLTGIAAGGRVVIVVGGSCVQPMIVVVVV